LDEAGAADDELGWEAAAAATPGSTGPVGSGFMMLTAGIEAALGKSILTTLRDGEGFAGTDALAGGATGAAAWTWGTSATGTSDAFAQIGK
jgi:hypothetical protein